MKKTLKRIIIVCLVIAMILTMTQISVKAVDNTYEVSTQEEFIDAMNDIHSNSNGNFVIKINADITIDGSIISSSNRLPSIDNGNTVTLKSSGSTITFSLPQYDKLNVSNGTLNLGSSNGSDTLTLKGPGEGHTSYNSLVSVSNGTVNMYSGITLKDNCSGATSLAAGGVRLNTNGIFNMYGGTIKDNKIETSELGGAVVADGDGSIFNMSGGVIENNTSVTWGGGVTINAATARLNITGGTIRNNSAIYGGGMLIGDGTNTISNATIEGNSALVGGGIMNYVNATISNCQIINNTATRGAGIANMDDGDPDTAYTLTLSNNTIKNNTSTERGGGIYSGISITSSGDTITGNQANMGGGVYLAGGDSNLSTAKVYNNKATTSGNDYMIMPNASNVKIMEAYLMDAEATFGDTTVPANLWHTDDNGNRFALDNNTSAVNVNNLDDDATYSLVAANGGSVVSYDDDGNESTANAKKALVLGNKVKLDANGGSVTADEIELNDSNVTVANPAREGFKFTGWTVYEVDGYELGLKANWEEVQEARYTVAFNANGGEGSMDSQEFTAGEEKELTANSFTKEGFTFEGWNTKEDGTGTVYADKASVKDLVSENNGTITLYAQWKSTEEATSDDEDNKEEPKEDEKEDTKEENKEDEEIKEPEFPITGDDSKKDEFVAPITGDNLAVWAGILGIAFAAFFTVRRKNKNRKYFNIL